MARKWEDWVNLVLGLWLLFSPAILGFTGTARTDALWVGAAVALVSIWALVQPGLPLAEWCDVLLGVGLFIAPWVLGFANQSGANWNAWIVGILVVIFSGLAVPDAARLGRTTTPAS